PDFKYLYNVEAPIAEKIETIAKEIYGGDGVVFTPKAQREMQKFADIGLDKLPVCMAKTQYSLSDDPTLLGVPKGFKVSVKEVRVSAGAGFIVCLTGDIMIMPGLPKIPAAEKIDIDENGVITGLF
ncbi:MAG: formate--tetrahydrofolate ligase, partial [Clostridiaceae bacterium]|nr:formate--tetrahydrofolate ligase [Clostridiaceae bacterium]